MRETFTAKSIEEAKQAAVEKFGVPADKIVFRVLEEPKKNLFGKIKREAVVEAMFELEETAAPMQTTESIQEENAPVEIETVQPSAETETLEEQSENHAVSIESEPIKMILTEEELSPNLIAAKQYIVEIYRAMGIAVTVEVMRTENSIRMELHSETKSGTIIGRRGETLDSIQYLASIIVNKGEGEYCRLLLDSNGYREKRKKTLEQLADKIARSVLRTGRSTTLEPMNPYERRIIHSRISEIEGVSSRSIGEDPYRKVVISSNASKRGVAKGGKGNRGKRPYRERQPEEFKRSNMDSMKTSFERDYKKPKPEDELHTGLYGKIEF